MQTLLMAEKTLIRQIKQSHYKAESYILVTAGQRKKERRKERRRKKEKKDKKERKKRKEERERKKERKEERKEKICYLLFYKATQCLLK